MTLDARLKHAGVSMNPRTFYLISGGVGLVMALPALVLGLKWAAYLLTGSLALYSDALESIVNVVTAVVALLAVRTSAKPAATRAARRSAR